MVGSGIIAVGQDEFSGAKKGGRAVGWPGGHSSQAVGKGNSTLAEEIGEQMYLPAPKRYNKARTSFPDWNMMPYERFDAWSCCHALAIAVYEATALLPKEEKYGLTSQARRAAFSAAANIAEGSAKRGVGEFQRYLNISLGSLSELAYAIRLAHDLKYLNEGDWRRLEDLRSKASKCTWGLYKSIRQRKVRPPDRPSA